MSDDMTSGRRAVRANVAADLYEVTPDAGGLFHWILASPFLMFLAWVWVDLFAYLSPISLFWLDAALGMVVFVAGIVGPLGLLAFWGVTSLPQVFGHAGWDVKPLEPLDERTPVFRYDFRKRHRVRATWRRLWARSAQGWVYLEIAAILLGGVLMVPVFLSASDFGFGRP